MLWMIYQYPQLRSQTPRTLRILAEVRTHQRATQTVEAKPPLTLKPSAEHLLRSLWIKQWSDHNKALTPLLPLEWIGRRSILSHAMIDARR